MAEGTSNTALDFENPRASREISDDEARDSLHILPLSILPLETPGLQRASLIKNVRLETVVEMFNDSAAGSGQVSPKDVPIYFESYPAEILHDMAIINKISRLNSFDVYSLRIELRRLQINVNDCAQLTLSEKKKAELTTYMREFTHPLIKYVYGNDFMKINDVSDIIRLFAHPNRDEAIRNLKIMADRLGVELHEIPSFLEEYGDIFLSLAYFRRCIDQIVPEIEKFIEWARECRNHNEIKRNPMLVRTIDDIIKDLIDISTSITGRFENFDKRSKDFWNDINADTFRKIRSLITAHHVTIGGVLCGLAVKMNLWKLRFARGSGGPNKRVEFIKSEVLPGLSHIKALENSGRSISE
ncbi:DUF3150 domain-containing protein [Azospirillaceae bacterium]